MEGVRGAGTAVGVRAEVMEVVVTAAARAVATVVARAAEAPAAATVVARGTRRRYPPRRR